MTFVAGAPCAKTISFARNVLTFLPRPAESRNNFTSNAEILKIVSLGERRVFTDLRRVWASSFAPVGPALTLSGSNDVIFQVNTCFGGIWGLAPTVNDQELWNGAFALAGPMLSSTNNSMPQTISCSIAGGNPIASPNGATRRTRFSCRPCNRRIGRRMSLAQVRAFGAADRARRVRTESP